MADHCCFCDTRRPFGGTNMLVLGDQWLEFCRRCGEREMLTNAETGETKCIADVFESLSGKPLENRPTVEERAEWARQRALFAAEAAAEEAARLRKKEQRLARLKGGCGTGNPFAALLS